jgi:hypothetical protein
VIKDKGKRKRGQKDRRGKLWNKHFQEKNKLQIDPRSNQEITYSKIIETFYRTVVPRVR